MATTLIFKDALVTTHRWMTQLGSNITRLNGTTPGWYPKLLGTTYMAGPTSTPTDTVTGPTSGIETGYFIASGDVVEHYISPPLDADVTISGTITLNLMAYESAMNANVAINIKIERLDSTGAIISTIAQSARTTELGTTINTNVNFTVTPTSTAMLKGDRIRATVYGDDAGTMGAGFTFTFQYGHSTTSSTIGFTETFGFLETAPTGSVLYLTDTAGPAVGANDEKEMWTSRGGGVTSKAVNTATGWAAPIQWTNGAGGTAMEWYSKPLTAFTLSGSVSVNMRAIESNALANTSIRCEIAVTNGDGSGAVVWGASSFADTISGTWPHGELPTAEDALLWQFAGDDVSVTNGQRLRLRVFIDDTSLYSMVTGYTATLYYAGTSAAASGDSYITLPQSVTEYVTTVTSDAGLFDRRTPRRRMIQRI
jgi:hypothetical protein